MFATDCLCASVTTEDMSAQSGEIPFFGGYKAKPGSRPVTCKAPPETPQLLFKSLEVPAKARPETPVLQAKASPARPASSAKVRPDTPALQGKGTPTPASRVRPKPKPETPVLQGYSGTPTSPAVPEDGEEEVIPGPTARVVPHEEAPEVVPIPASPGHPIDISSSSSPARSRSRRCLPGAAFSIT